MAVRQHKNVKSGQTIAGQNPTLSGIVRKRPICPLNLAFSLKRFMNSASDRRTRHKLADK